MRKSTPLLIGLMAFGPIFADGGRASAQGQRSVTVVERSERQICRVVSIGKDGKPIRKCTVATKSSKQKLPARKAVGEAAVRQQWLGTLGAVFSDGAASSDECEDFSRVESIYSSAVSQISDNYSLRTNNGPLKGPYKKEGLVGYIDSGFSFKGVVVPVMLCGFKTSSSNPTIVCRRNVDIYSNAVRLADRYRRCFIDQGWKDNKSIMGFELPAVGSSSKFYAHVDKFRSNNRFPAFVEIEFVRIFYGEF